MDLAKLIVLGIKISIILIVFGLGLKSRLSDLVFLAKQPSLLARSILSMNIIMPLLAAAIVAAFSLKPDVAIALVALAISPVPPILPIKQSKLGGNKSYIYGLLFAAALLSIVLIPLSVKLLALVFRWEASVPLSSVAAIVLRTVLLPLGAGLAVGHLAPAFSRRIEPIVSRLGGLALLIGLVPILLYAGHLFLELIGNGSLAAITAVVLLGLVVGHLLGGPERANQSVLALATAARHPGVAMAIASSLFPGQKLVPAAILLYLLVSVLLSIPYMKWLERRHASQAAPEPVAPQRDKAA
jgi:BASS family bile acid:Na+ symporter